VSGRPSSGPAAAGAPSAGSGLEPPPPKKELPFERIPTPGVTPYVWSPPASMFQPSPSPPGTPFVGSPYAGGMMDASESVQEDGYMKQPRNN
jgi:hypothetical protein